MNGIDEFTTEVNDIFLQNDLRTKLITITTGYSTADSSLADFAFQLLLESPSSTQLQATLNYIDFYGLNTTFGKFERIRNYFIFHYSRYKQFKSLNSY